MTQEDKELLLKDLNARLPYGVKFKAEDEECIRVIHYIKDEEVYIREYRNLPYWIDTIKPYLRPMSSMTEEEKKEFSVFIGKTEVYTQQICLDADSMANPIIGGNKCVYWGLFDKCIDWLNKKMFDYRGLIPMGLALEAPEGMYNIKEK